MAHLFLIRHRYAVLSQKVSLKFCCKTFERVSLKNIVKFDLTFFTEVCQVAL